MLLRQLAFLFLLMQRVATTRSLLAKAPNLAIAAGKSSLIVVREQMSKFILVSMAGAEPQPPIVVQDVRSVLDPAAVPRLPQHSLHRHGHLQLLQSAVFLHRARLPLQYHHVLH